MMSHLTFFNLFNHLKLHLHSKDSGTVRLWIWRPQTHTYTTLYLCTAVSKGLCQLNTGRLKTPVC